MGRLATHYALAALAVALAVLELPGALGDPAPPPPGYCPDTWPAVTLTTNDTAYIHVAMNFTKMGLARCKNKRFPGNEKLFAASAAQMMRASLTALGVMMNQSAALADYAFTPLNGTSACVERGKMGTASAVIAFKYNGTQEGPSLSSLLQPLSVYHLSEFCPKNSSAYEWQGDALPAQASAPVVAWCKAVRGGAAKRWPLAVHGCVKDLPFDDPDMTPGRAACFPGDATVTRVTSVTDAPAGPARMDELAIGDAVACLVPDGVERGAALRDDALAFRPGVCHVYGYLDADKARRKSYVHLHYTNAAGKASVLRATGNHLVYVAATPIPAASPAAALAPGGVPKRADAVAVGDLLAVQGEGGLYTAPVTAITSEAASGAFAPLLTRAGIPVVDGAVAFPWVHLTGGAPHPMTHLGEHFRHTRLWLDFEASRASGCAGAACPCLDAPDGGAACVRLGDRLADVPPGWSDFEKRFFKLYVSAAAQGRTHPDYATAIALGRAYASRPWLRRAAVALGMKPHTLGLWAANRALIRPPVA